MPRLFPCKSFAQAHIIRAFLSTHDVETHVLHENAATLWCTSGPGCVLSIHETDLEFLPEILSTPRESLTDDEDIPTADFSESGPGPMHYDSGFFIGMILLGVFYIMGFGILCLALYAIHSFALEQTNSVNVPIYQQLGLRASDVFASISAGLIGGLLAGVAIVTARQFRPDERGEMPIIPRWFTIILLCMTEPIFYVIWLLYLLVKYLHSPSSYYD